MFEHDPNHGSVRVGVPFLSLFLLLRFSLFAASRGRIVDIRRYVFMILGRSDTRSWRQAHDYNVVNQWMECCCCRKHD